MPKTSIVLAVLALGLVTACDDPPGDKTDSGDGKDSEAKASFGHATADKLSGTFFYIGSKGDDEVVVWSYVAGEKPREVLSGDVYLWGSATPSPDGRYISHVDADAKLRIWDVTAGKQLDFSDTSADGTCVEPVWTPDSEALLVHGVGPDSQSSASLVEVPTGESTDVEPAKGCHVRFAPGGDEDEYGALAGDLSGITLYDGDDETTIPGDAVSGRMIVDLVAMARDNAALCVATVKPGDTVGDAARSLTCDTIIDTKTGKPVELPGDITAALFPESGGFVTRTADGDLVLSDKDKNGIATVKEPAELAEGFLIGYAEP